MSTPPSTPHDPVALHPPQAAPDGAPDRVAVSHVFSERAAHRMQVKEARHRTPEEHERSARNEDGRTTQHALLVMAPVLAGHLDELKTLLAEVANPKDGNDFEVNCLIPFARLRTVHFARILVHDPSPSAQAPIPRFGGKPLAKGAPIPAKLLFATDFDGPLDEHLDELLAVAGPGLDRVFAHVEGWPGLGDLRAVHDFVRRHSVPTNTFYTGTMHRSVDQIHREAELHARIEAHLDEMGPQGRGDDPVALRDRIRAWVFAQPELAWAAHRPGPFPRLLFNPDYLGRVLLGVGLAAFAALVLLARLVLPSWLAAVLGVAAVVLAVAGGALLYLLRLEARDPVVIGNDVKEHTAELVRTEDRIVQNEMSSVIYIKQPLWFRGTVLRAVLAFINLSAKYLSNQGTLAGIPSIHFARWTIVDGGRRLVFFSNFDGSWDNYLGDFIDKSASGLTAVWSNCVGFPRTRLLVGGGARDEQKFKAYSRDSQIPTQVWYSAYRWLSVDNINNNSRIRLGLYDEMTAEEAHQWLRRFGGSTNVDNTGAALPAGPPARARAEPVEMADVQGLVARSYKSLAHAEYIPVRFPADSAAGRRWVGEMAERVTAANVPGHCVDRIGCAVNLAFTRPGLAALGMADETIGTFSREFTEGMTEEHRTRLMGDDGDSDPSTWEWGGPGKEVHGMLFIFAVSAQELRERVAAEEARAAQHGVRLEQALESIMLENDKEHFGFHDGIAQPRVAGFGRPDDGESPAPTEGDVAPGEVVLGYHNVYGRLPMSPTAPVTKAGEAVLPLAPADPDAAPGSPARLDLGRNGSYMVFRTLEQRVQAFWRFLDEQARHQADERKRLGAKMVGRWPNGAPLVTHPDAEPPSFDRKTGNDFMYSPSDLRGDRCPIGAHIRRTNPRDGMAPGPEGSLLVADRHRLLRRGRAYGRPLAPSFDPADILAAQGSDSGRGLHFIAFNTDLARQFEFVQSTWVNSRKFDGLYTDPDPVIGPHADPGSTVHPEEVSTFTEQRCPVRHRVHGIPRFVVTRGGTYLFMPGLRALRFISVME